MSLKTGKPPAKAFQLVSEAIQELATRSGDVMAAMGGSPTSAELTNPLRVYTLGLEDLRESSLKKAKGTSWRYLVLRSDQLVGAAEVDATRPSRARFSHFNSGPFVEGMASAIVRAEKLPEVERSDYEARILKIPALYVMALWLHNKTDDLLIPIPPTNENLTPNEVYSTKEFFKILALPGRRRMNFDDSPNL